MRQLLRMRAEKASAGVSTWRSAGHMVHLALGLILYNVYLSTTSAFLRTVALNNLTFSRSWTRFVASTYLVCRWKPASRIRSPLIHSNSSCSWEVLHPELLGTRIVGMVKMACGACSVTLIIVWISLKPWRPRSTKWSPPTIAPVRHHSHYVIHDIFPAKTSTNEQGKKKRDTLRIG